MGIWKRLSSLSTKRLEVVIGTLISMPVTKSSFSESAARHVAIIMDGNGRWAQSRGKPRLYGHHKGVENVRCVVDTAKEMGIPYLTLYAFDPISQPLKYPFFTAAARNTWNLSSSVCFRSSLRSFLRFSEAASFWRARGSSREKRLRSSRCRLG